MGLRLAGIPSYSRGARGFLASTMSTQAIRAAAGQVRAGGRPGRENHMRYSRVEHAKIQSLQDEVGRAEADYRRLRQAYLEVARTTPDHEVALAMIGADVERAHARLQEVTGQARTPHAEAQDAERRRH